MARTVTLLESAGVIRRTSGCAHTRIYIRDESLLATSRAQSSADPRGPHDSFRVTEMDAGHRAAGRGLVHQATGGAGETAAGRQLIAAVTARKCPGRPG